MVTATSVTMQPNDNNHVGPGGNADSERSVSDDDTHPHDEPTNKRGFKRPIDESLLSEEEAKRLEARRAYNRQCAAKARKRSKDLISQLQGQVENLTRDKAELERSNEVMKAQLQLLEQQNKNLIMNQQMQGFPVTSSAAFSAAGGLAGMRSSLMLPGQTGSMMHGSSQFPNSSLGILESLSGPNRLGLSFSGAPTGANGLPCLSRAPAGAIGLDTKIYYG